MKALYGNYDAAKKSSTFRLTKKFPNTFFDKPGKVEVHEFLAAGAMDRARRKSRADVRGARGGPGLKLPRVCTGDRRGDFREEGRRVGGSSVEKSLRRAGKWRGPPQTAVARGSHRGCVRIDAGDTNQGETERQR